MINFANNKDWFSQGVFEGILAEDYHKVAAASQSLLRKMAISCAHGALAWAKMGRTIPGSKPSAPMIKGTAYHTIMEDRDEFLKTYARLPEGDGRKPHVKAAKKEAEELGQTPLSASDYDDVLNMEKATKEHSSAWPLVQRCKYKELSMSWEDEDTGTICKGRVDLYGDELGIVVDYKTTYDCTPFSVPNTVASDRLYLQPGHYLTGLEQLGFNAERFVWLFIGSSAPYPIIVRECPYWVIEAAKAECKKLLNAFAYCLDNNVWPCYDPSIEFLQLPSWKEKELDELTGRVAI